MKINQKVLIIILITLLILATLYYIVSISSEEKKQTQNSSTLQNITSSPVQIYGAPVISEEKINLGG